jgi:hypothetical protein
MVRQHFQLTSGMARADAVAAICRAPDGYSVVIGTRNRTLDQNAMIWKIFSCFSRQLLWTVNGTQQKITQEDWKSILTAAFTRETRMADGINGGVVMLGKSTRIMSVKEMADFIEFILSVASDRGVNINE